MKEIVVSIVTVNEFSVVQVKWGKAFITMGKNWKLKSKAKFPLKTLFKALLRAFLMQFKSKLKGD